VSDHLAVYGVVPSAEAGQGRAIGARLRRLPRAAQIALGIGIPLAIVGLGLLGSTILRGASALPVGTWKIALDAPLTGNTAFRGTPMKNAAQLAIDQANGAGFLGGATLVLQPFDDSGPPPNGQDPQRGAANARAMVEDRSVVAMIGPASSKVAAAQIPVTNRAGLLQCSPANSDPGLTKPRAGALDLRSAFPNRINYVRTFPADDIQGKALASDVFTDLAARTALVIDDADQGRTVADQFSAAYTKLGGTGVRLALNKGADPRSVLGPLGAPSGAPSAVFFGGFTNTGAAAVRTAMVATGHGSVPFVSWDGIQDGSGADEGSFISSTGSAAVGSYLSHASTGPPKADFADSYRAQFDTEPDEYSASTHACAEVIVSSLRAIAPSGPSADVLREALRAYATDPSHLFDTVLGTVGFDANGDSREQFVTFYRVDTTAAGGKGDWALAKQQDYGPAP
jgi:branched-chain amino acid transport system substrate-binding protein